MDIASLTPDALGEALERLRQARPLEGSPLLGLALLEDRLRRDGMAVRPTSLAWCLGTLLDEIVRDHLARARGDPPDARTDTARDAPAVGATGPAATSPADDRRRVAEDFAAGHADREAWSCLYHRYFSPLDLRIQEIVALSGASTSHVRRRRLRGLDLLAGILREREVTAAATAHLRPDAPARERIIVGPGQAGVATTGSTGGAAEIAAGAVPPNPEAVRMALLEVVRSDDRLVRLTPGEAESVARHPVADLVEYRLGRIAEWSQPRYRLDGRFVALTLLVDRGDQVTGDRWQAREERFESLAGVLAAVDDPAVVVLGPPGSGKSTLLRHFELDAAIAAFRRPSPAQRERDRRGHSPSQSEGEGAPITFFISLSQFQGETPSDLPAAPLPWLAAEWRARHPALPPLEDLVAEGRMVLLLDALNEMPGAGDEAAYWHRVHLWQRFLAETIRAHPGNRAIFACRSLDYSAPLSTPSLPVPQVRIEPLADEQVRAFLRSYAPAIVDGVWRELEGSPQLDLFRSPYFLKLLVEHVEAEGRMPQGRAALFSSLVQQAIRREVERYNPLFAPGEIVTARDTRRVLQAGWRAGSCDLPDEGALVPRLGQLAHGMQERRTGPEMSQVRIGYHDALALIDHPRAADIVRAGEALAVLDEDVGRDEVLFRHQLVQEYFAAREFAKAPSADLVRAESRAAHIRPSVRELIETLPPGERLPPLPTTGWEETAVLAAAMAADAEGFVRAIAEANLALAGRCAVQAEVRERLGEGYLHELRWALVARSRDREADLRNRIACGLAVGELGDPRFERREGPYGEYLMPPMIEIPGGRYPIGEDEAIWNPQDERWERKHLPRHEVEIAAFQIGRFPVTNAEWACFMAAGGYEDERWWDTEAARAWRRGEGTAEGLKSGARRGLRKLRTNPRLLEEWHDSGQIDDEVHERWQRRLAMTEGEFEAHLSELYPGRRETEPRYWGDERFNNPSQPVVGISWYEARAYGSWLSAQVGGAFRLPSEVEWEAAVRGVEGRLYAYGDTLDATKASILLTRLKRTTPVGVFVEGDTPEGAGDMGGNVSQWTTSMWGRDDELVPEYAYPYDASDGREDVHAGPDCPRVFRSASWSYIDFFARAAFRDADDPGYRGSGVGFRVVRSVPIR